MSAVIVDISRLLVYGISFYSARLTQIKQGIGWLVLFASISAFIGSFIGSRLISKVTFKAIQIIVGIMLILLGLALGFGLI